MGPFGRGESHVDPVRVMAPGRPRMVDLEPTSPSSLGAVAGSIGKYLDVSIGRARTISPAAFDGLLCRIHNSAVPDTIGQGLASGQNT